MHIEFPDQHGTGTSVGAVVVRSNTTGDLFLDFGPADGAPSVRLSMSPGEAESLTTAITSVMSAGEELTLIFDDRS